MGRERPAAGLTVRANRLGYPLAPDWTEYRFGIPGVISVFAMVFALVGGAHAATDGASTSAKRDNRAKKKSRT